MDTVKKAAQEFQNEAQRKTQNSRMLFYCITASISQSVMDKLSLKTHLFTLLVRDKPVQDGVCMLKVLIDSYYASTRFTTIEIRKQLANLPIYMQTVALYQHPYLLLQPVLLLHLRLLHYIDLAPHHPSRLLP
jgi:hypothetical protein